MDSDIGWSVPPFVLQVGLRSFSRLDLARENRPVSDRRTGSRRITNKANALVSTWEPVSQGWKMVSQDMFKDLETTEGRNMWNIHWWPVGLRILMMFQMYIWSVASTMEHRWQRCFWRVPGHRQGQRASRHPSARQTWASFVTQHSSGTARGEHWIRFCWLIDVGSSLRNLGVPVSTTLKAQTHLKVQYINRSLQHKAASPLSFPGWAKCARSSAWPSSWGT